MPACEPIACVQKLGLGLGLGLGVQKLGLGLGLGVQKHTLVAGWLTLSE